jgi:hypothetical protein
MVLLWTGVACSASPHPFVIRILDRRLEVVEVAVYVWGVIVYRRRAGCPTLVPARV